MAPAQKSFRENRIALDNAKRIRYTVGMMNGESSNEGSKAMLKQREEIARDCEWTLRAMTEHCPAEAFAQALTIGIENSVDFAYFHRSYIWDCIDELVRLMQETRNNGLDDLLFVRYV